MDVCRKIAKPVSREPKNAEGEFGENVKIGSFAKSLKNVWTTSVFLIVPLNSVQKAPGIVQHKLQKFPENTKFVSKIPKDVWNGQPRSKTAHVKITVIKESVWKLVAL